MLLLKQAIQGGVSWSCTHCCHAQVLSALTQALHKPQQQSLSIQPGVLQTHAQHTTAHTQLPAWLPSYGSSSSQTAACLPQDRHHWQQQQQHTLAHTCLAPHQPASASFDTLLHRHRHYSSSSSSSSQHFQHNVQRSSSSRAQHPAATVGQGLRGGDVSADNHNDDDELHVLDEGEEEDDDIAVLLDDELDGPFADSNEDGGVERVRDSEWTNEGAVSTSSDQAAAAAGDYQEDSEEDYDVQFDDDVEFDEGFDWTDEEGEEQLVDSLPLATEGAGAEEQDRRA